MKIGNVIDLRSWCKGWLYWRPGNAGVNYTVRWLPRMWWAHLLTPIWHEGRGPYVSIGLWVVALYRGY